MKKLLAICLITVFFLFSSLGALSSVNTSSMKEVLGVDFGEDFAIEIDFNIDTGAIFPADDVSVDIQVLRDFNNISVNPADSNPLNDQQYFFSHFNTSGISTSYFALEKIEQDLIIQPPFGAPAVNLGHVNGSVPFQTLLQHFTHGAVDVLVANTFRGYIAYTTTPDDPTIDASDSVFLGYTLVEEHLIDRLNLYLSDAGFSDIPAYGYEPIYDKATMTFGMNYTNFFVVWQGSDAQGSELDLLNALADLQGFEGVATGGAIQAASLFDYLTFTFTINEVVANATHTIIDVVTKYDLGPMSWLITRDDSTLFDNLNSFLPTINSGNSFHRPSEVLSFSTGWTGFPTIDVTIPALSFYTGEAVPTRIDASAVFSHGASGFGIAVVTSTNVVKLGSTLDDPLILTDNPDDPVIPLNFDGSTVFETSFAQKAHYDRTFPNGTKQTGLPVYVSTRTLDQVQQIVNIGSAFSLYFQAQSAQTIGFTRFAARQLIPALSNEDIHMDVSSTAYVTFVQMPLWSGLEVVQDPTYSAVSAVSGIVSTDSSGTGTGTGSTSGTGNTSVIPGFELLTVFLVVPVVVLFKKRK